MDRLKVGRMGYVLAFRETDQTHGSVAGGKARTWGSRAIARGLIEANGGRLEVESFPGQGATFV